jgi:hypothetical protein
MMQSILNVTSLVVSCWDYFQVHASGNSLSSTLIRLSYVLHDTSIVGLLYLRLLIGTDAAKCRTLHPICADLSIMRS